LSSFAGENGDWGYSAELRSQIHERFGVGAPKIEHSYVAWAQWHSRTFDFGTSSKPLANQRYSSLSFTRTVRFSDHYGPWSPS
jgi:hypothetical protein